MQLMYRVATAALRGVSPLLAFGSSKLARGIRGRRAAVPRLVHWGTTIRDRDRPVAWFHAPSVGEGHQALAVARAMQMERPDLQVVYTHFSPSAEAFAERSGADVHAFLPWDQRSSVGAVLDALEPTVLIFTKTEVWPVLVEEAARRSIPVALVAGSVPAGAGRASRLGRRILGATWPRVDLVCADGPEDADRLLGLGARPSVVHEVGDPGIDSALGRLQAADTDAPHLALLGGGDRPTLVAGSTWPSDEAVLLSAVERVRVDRPDLRVVIAPHEPHPSHLRALRARCPADAVVASLTELEARGTADGVDVVLIDRVGILAELYTLAAVAFVGGGYHGDGLHSVVEPAAARCPVVFGPRHGNSRTASGLLEVGGGATVPDAPALAATLRSWLQEPDLRDRTARSAFDYIRRHRGAALRTARLVDSLMRAERE